MRSGPPPRDEVGAPPEAVTSAPVRELYPTMDARFILVEIGKLMSQTEANTKAVNELGGKISSLEQTVKNAALIGKVVIAVITVLAGLIWWLASTLWPLRDKLIPIFFGGNT